MVSTRKAQPVSTIRISRVCSVINPGFTYNAVAYIYSREWCIQLLRVSLLERTGLDVTHTRNSQNNEAKRSLSG